MEGMTSRVTFVCYWRSFANSANITYSIIATCYNAYNNITMHKCTHSPNESENENVALYCSFPVKGCRVHDRRRRSTGKPAVITISTPTVERWFSLENLPG